MSITATFLDVLPGQIGIILEFVLAYVEVRIGHVRLLWNSCAFLCYVKLCYL